MSKRRILSYVCAFAAFVLLVLAVALPLYGKKARDYNEKYDVIEGSDGFLFSARSAFTDELADFSGQTSYDAEVLSRTVEALSGSASALADRGCASVFVLVPSKMSVYRDKLPGNVAKRYSQTRKYTELCAAMTAAGLDVIELSGLFGKYKDSEQLFHTASDAINDAGGYRLFTAAAGAAGLAALPEDGYTARTSEDYNYPLTREYRNETGKTVPNRTVTLTENNVTYKDDERYAFGVTATKNSEKTGSVIVFSAGAGNSVSACRKFFSAAAGTAVFVDGMIADETVLDRYAPGHAVFVIYEGDVRSLPLKSMQPQTDPDLDSSAAPVIDAVVYSSGDCAVIFGKAEAESTVTVKGGEKVVSRRTENGAFAAEVPIRTDTERSELYVTAKTDGKNESDPVTVNVKYEERVGYKNVRVGKYGHLHYEETVPDFTGASALSDGDLQGYVNYLRARSDRIHAVSPDTKIIYVIPPNHLTIYPETAPDDLVEGATSRLRQFIEAFKDDDSLIFLDLITPLTEAKQTAPYRLYNKTDTHWNELGAYYAYVRIMDEISKDFPAAAPDPLSGFDVFTKSVNGGDMANFLGADLNAVREDGVYVRSKKPLFSGIEKDYSMNFENVWFSDQHEFAIDDASLPTMIMYRDSFSTNLMSFLAEKFSCSVFHTMWDYPEETELWEQMKPDYIIIEHVERGLGGI